MKKIAFILSIMILTNAVKGSPAIQFFKDIVSIECEHNRDDTCHADEEEHSDCCNDMGCDCSCCVHILISNTYVLGDFVPDIFGEENHRIVQGPHTDYNHLVFHPPT